MHAPALMPGLKKFHLGCSRLGFDYTVRFFVASLMYDSPFDIDVTFSM
jgi:hypothetical protein